MSMTSLSAVHGCNRGNERGGEALLVAKMSIDGGHRVVGVVMGSSLLVRYS